MATTQSAKSIGEQFKGLDAKDPSVWPKAPKIALMAAASIAIFAAAYFVDWDPQVEEIDIGQQEEVKLKDEYVGKYRQAVNLDLYQQQLVEVNALLGKLLKQLPNKSQMEALITDINSAGISRGLGFELFKPAAQETKREVYGELPISIKVTGTYHNMGEFAADIGQLSRIVTLNDISLQASTAQGVSPGTLIMDATAKTYRYLDESELTEARQAAAAARKKK